MGTFHDQRFPGESETYRSARDRLLQAEINLRKQIEEVAALRRELPLGGKVNQDYRFEEHAGDSETSAVIATSLSELFAPGKSSLVLYSFMFAPEWEKPCPMCTSLLDGLNGIAPHVQDLINFAAVAKAPIQRIAGWARARGWRNLRLLSSANCSYNRDYGAEGGSMGQMPAINVFQKIAGDVYHFYNAELFYAAAEPGQHPRHADLIWPVWNLFDLTPEGRATDWYPKLAYP